MAFVHTTLEAVHAQDTSGIYCTIPAKSTRRGFVTWSCKCQQKHHPSSETEDAPLKWLHKLSCMTTSPALDKPIYFNVNIHSVNLMSTWTLAVFCVAADSLSLSVYYNDCSVTVFVSENRKHTSVSWQMTYTRVKCLYASILKIS